MGLPLPRLVVAVTAHEARFLHLLVYEASVGRVWSVCVLGFSACLCLGVPSCWSPLSPASSGETHEAQVDIFNSIETRRMTSMAPAPFLVGRPRITDIMDK